MSRTLAAHDRDDAQVEVAILDEEPAAEINQRHRGKDGPTDVLSFVAPKSAAPHLGEIAICAQLAERQARARNATPNEEAIVLAIHGCLHLLGFDDATDEEAEIMNQEMERIAGAKPL